jgi:hypothetical protein
MTHFSLFLKRQQARNANKEKEGPDFEVNSSYSSQKKGTASDQAQRKNGFVHLTRPDDLGSLGDHVSAEQVSWSHPRSVPRSVLDLFEKQKEHAHMKLREYDANSEPSVSQVVREEAQVYEKAVVDCVLSCIVDISRWLTHSFTILGYC